MGARESVNSRSGPGGPPDPERREPDPVYAGRYAVRRELGSGGHGRVLHAFDQRLEREVAVKVLAPGRRDERQLRRFAQEARTAGWLNHPNILTVFDVGEQDGEPYLVTELLHGKTLREILRAGPLPTANAADFAIQLADGLRAAHEAGIVHRDLKPENLFVCENGRLKILDFGIAKLLDEGRRGITADTGSIVGTVGYMSPEQVRGEHVDHRSDIFAFGVILYEMLSATAPFDRATPVETGYAILSYPPAALPSSVPAGLSRVVAHCLAKHPADRFQSCDELIDELPRAAASVRVGTVRRVIGVAVLALVFAAGAMAWVAYHSRPRVVTVAVLPFAVRGPAEIAYLGDGIVDLLSATLANANAHAVDANLLLAHLAREGWSPDPTRAREVAARFGATHYVLGSVLEVGSRLRIHAALYDRDAGLQPVDEATLEGESTRVFELVDDLSLRLRLGGGGPITRDRLARIAEVTTSSPVALKAYLEGRQHFRWIDTRDEAREDFARAIAADPSFALAHAELSYAAAYANDFGPAIVEAKRALELASQLPEHDRLRIVAWEAHLRGKYRDAERIARELVKAHPDDFDAHAALAAPLVFWGHLDGIPYVETLREAEIMGELGPQQDVWYLIRDLIIAGEFERARSLADKLLSMAPAIGETSRLRARYARALIAGDAVERDATVSQIARLAPHSGYKIALLIPGGLADADRLARGRFEISSSDGHEALATIAMVRGQLANARKEKALQLTSKPDLDDQLSMAGFSALFPFVPFEPQQLAADLDAVAAYRAEGDLRHRRLMLLGRLSAMLGDTAAAERAAGELERTVIGLEGSTLGPDWASWIRATIAARAGRPAEALATIEQIRGEVPMVVPWWWGWAAYRYERAELLYQLMRYDDAERWFLTNERFHGIEFQAPRARRLAQIEDRRGNTKKAIAYYERFVDLWSACDPELRPQVDAANARLAALRGR
jgi:tetratricopeptide (TPR) repeat protein